MHGVESGVCSRSAEVPRTDSEGLQVRWSKTRFKAYRTKATPTSVSIAFVAPEVESHGT